MDGVEGAGEHEPLRDRLAHRGAVPEVGKRGVGAPLDDALHLGLAHALDVGERQSNAVGIIGCPLDGIRRAGSIDVEAEDRDAETARVVEDEPLGIHARVVGEHAGEECRRMVRLEPRGLIRRQCERRGMGLAEAEGGEGAQHLPHALDGDEVIAVGEGSGIEPRAHVVLALGRAHGATGLVGLGQRAAGHGGHDAQHLLVEDDDAVGLGEDRAQVVVDVDGVVPSLPRTQEGGDHVGLDRAGAEERDIDDDVVEGVGGELADELALAG